MINSPPVLGFCAQQSGTGKTTLLEQLIPALHSLGIRVSVIKHAHHQFDIDHKGKDSYRLREAGAVQTLVASNQRWALMTELARTPNLDNEADLSDLLAKLNPDFTDLVLVEGFKDADIAKIEVYRKGINTENLATHDKNIIAIATDIALPIQTTQIDLNDIDAIAGFIETWLNHQTSKI